MIGEPDSDLLCNRLDRGRMLSRWYCRSRPSRVAAILVICAVEHDSLRVVIQDERDQTATKIVILQVRL